MRTTRPTPSKQLDTRTNAEGSGPPLGTSVIVTVVLMVPTLLANVPVPLNKGLTKVATESVALEADQHGPAWPPGIQEAVPPLKVKLVIGNGLSHVSELNTI